MFDLEAAVNVWRRQAEAQGTRQPAALAELEDHLREAFAELVQFGHAEQDAWRMAAAKLGDPAAIGREFAKVDRLPMIDRIALGILLGAAALAVACMSIGMISRGAAALDDPLLTVHVVTITLGYLSGLLAAALAAYASIRSLASRTAMPILSGATLRLVRVASVAAAVLSAAGFVLGAAWANGEWGRTFSADPYEIGAIVVVVSFVAAAAAAWTGAAVHVALASAITGGGLVLAAWFGAAAHANGYPPLLATVGFGGAAACLALAALSLKAPRISGVA